MSHTDGKANIQHESTVALPAATVRHGTAAGINLARPLRDSKSSLRGSQWIRFYVGELTGMFFIFLCMATPKFPVQFFDFKTAFLVYVLVGPSGCDS